MTESCIAANKYLAVLEQDNASMIATIRRLTDALAKWVKGCRDCHGSGFMSDAQYRGYGANAPCPCCTPHRTLLKEMGGGVVIKEYEAEYWKQVSDSLTKRGISESTALQLASELRRELAGNNAVYNFDPEYVAESLFRNHCQ